VAKALSDELENVGLDVWLADRTAGIDEAARGPDLELCAAFVPIISRHVTTVERRFFRLEWRRAVEERQMRPSDVPFIFPVVIDDTLVNDPSIPPEFQKVQSTLYAGTEIPSSFINVLRNLVRGRRRER
jgi:hypothetical protein